MTWEAVFSCIGYTFSFCAILTLVGEFLKFVYNARSMNKLLAKKENIIKNSNSEAAYAVEYKLVCLNNEIKQRKVKLETPIDWNGNYKEIVLFTGISAIGLILAYFGISGTSGYNYF